MTPSLAPSLDPRLGPRRAPGRGWADELSLAAGIETSDIAGLLPWLVGVGAAAPLPGQGETAELWNLLAGIAATDVAMARVLEPHLDALAILAQARAEITDLDDDLARVNAGAHSTWGVFAAEGPGVRLEAHATAGRWHLTGTKPWCSLANDLSHALVTAWVSSEQRALFAVDLRAAGVAPHLGPWVARGLPRVVSAPVDFDDVAAVPVGDAGWYLRRAGFAWGGMGVAAIWWGAAVPLGDAVRRAAARAGADQLAATFAGRADSALWSARAVLAEAAELVDAGVTPAEAKLLAARVREVVAEAAERILLVADRALGAAPLATEEHHARRVADLHLYLRQHHAERDAARLGQRVASS